LAPIASVCAYNGGVQDMFIANEEFLASENQSFLTFYNTEYTRLKDYLENMKKCSAKHKYYNPGSASIDAEGCYDIMAKFLPVSAAAKEAAYVGKIDVASGNFANGKNAGVLEADSQCNTNFADSRAMRYDDMKYLVRDGAWGTTATSIFVFDAIKMIHDDNNVILKSGDISIDNPTTSDWNCANYTSADANKRSVRFKRDGTNSMMLDVSAAVANCSLPGAIFCVKDK